ncbi:MAG: NADH:flavin oxidoreductase [Desulfovibrio sp.]|jgi:2,4-dienoyl-CoA reductase-like NADH-dependent reductase (Old Yellow Enzyme family)|nr:NADH:flavin oxidoreductase [Desulfovibrio sp.]
MKKMFEPSSVGGLSLRNRFIRSATFEYVYDNENNTFADKLLPMYEKLASNGVAAIITGMVGVDENSRAASVMVKAYGSSFVPELAKVVAAVHVLGTKLIVQINHCGQKAGQIDGGGSLLGPCDTKNAQGSPVKGMNPEQIRSVAASFAETAVRCKEAGADAVQIHAAHGYLLSEFLNPYFNKRADEYGRGIEGRARIVFEVYDAVREAVGKDYPVWIKINSRDLTEPSITPEEFRWVCAELDKRGIDAIEVSGGAAVSPESASTPFIKKEEDEGFFGREALEVAETASASVISVCGYRTPAVIEQWLNKGKIDAISMCRPLISEPDLIGCWERGDMRKARCVSCSKCFTPELKCIPFGEKSENDKL